MASYTLRGVDDAFWKRVKVYAAQKGITVRALTLQLLGQAAGTVHQETHEAARTASGRAQTRKR